MNADDAAPRDDESHTSNHGSHATLISDDIPAADNTQTPALSEAEADEGAPTTFDHPEVSFVSTRN